MLDKFPIPIFIFTYVFLNNVADYVRITKDFFGTQTTLRKQ